MLVIIEAINTPTGTWHYGGTIAYLDIYSSAQFDTFDGQAILPGHLAKLDAYLRVNCEIQAGNVLYIPAVQIDSTLDSPTNTAARYIAVIRDYRGVIRVMGWPGNLSSWSLTNVASQRWEDIINRNSAQSLSNPAPTYLNQTQIQALIDSALGARNFASNNVLGVTYLDKAPTIPNTPIAVSINSDLLTPPITSFASSDYVSLNAAVAAIGSTPGALLIEAASFPSGNSCTVPSTLVIDWGDVGTLLIAAAQVVTFESDGSAWPIRQLFFGTGTIDFTGNDLLPKGYLQWFGVTGDGTTDDTAAFQAAITAFNTVHIQPTSGMLIRLTGTVTWSLKRGLMLVSGIDAQNDPSLAPRLIWDAAGGGVMFDLAQCQYCHIEGFNFTLGSGAEIDSFIVIDGDPTSQISTGNVVRYNTISAGNQANAACRVISISPTATQNNEDIEVSHNVIYGSNGTGAAALGVGIYNGSNPNAKHQRFYFNDILNCAIAVHSLNGSFDLNHLGGGHNGVDIKIDNRTEPISISFIETENSIQGAHVAAAGQPLSFANCRFSNFVQGANAWLALDGPVTLTNSRFEADPPVGQKLIGDLGTGNLQLISIQNLYSAAFTTSMAEVGFDVFAALVGVNDSRFVVSIGDFGISNAPSSPMFILGGFGGLGPKFLALDGTLALAGTATAGGTTGNRIINKPAGSVNFAAGAAALTVTNNMVTATSVVICMIQTNDTTAEIKNVVPGSGSFVINMVAAVTAETKVGFVVLGMY